MEKNFDRLPPEFQALLKQENLAEAVAQAQETLNNPEKIKAMIEASGIPSEALANPELLLKMTQAMVMALDPAIKQSLSSFVDQMVAGAPTPPPPEVQSFLDNVLGPNDKKE